MEWIELALIDGFAPTFKLISNEQQKTDNINALERRNHKLALKHIEVLSEAVEKDTKLGFQFLFDPSIISDIPHSVVSLYGIAIQNTLDKNKNIILKYRPICDLSID